MRNSNVIIKNALMKFAENYNSCDNPGTRNRTDIHVYETLANLREANVINETQERDLQHDYEKMKERQ